MKKYGLWRSEKEAVQNNRKRGRNKKKKKNVGGKKKPTPKHCN